MSETPSQSTSSPQKRTNDENLENDSKRAKVSDSSYQNFESFDLNDLGLPTGTTNPSSPLKVEIPLVPTTSTQPSASTSVMNTPGQFNLDLPDLPGETPSPSFNANNSKSPATNQSTIPPQDKISNNQENGDSSQIIKPPAPADPDKLSDALLSAGVDLKAEEALLNSTVNNLPTRLDQIQGDINLLQKPIILNTPFLDPRQLSAFMSKVVNVNGIKQNFDNEESILQLMTNACEDWMSNIVTNAVIISRHRRRSIKQRKRSELSKALRELAVQQKAQEDKRIQKRKNLGIDQEDQNKLGTEETQHKATNATVAMMTAGKKKKYSWMTGGGSGGGGTKAASGAPDGGIRFREAREEPGIAVRDLLSSLEKKRFGVEKVLTKGYSKLKD